MDIHQIIDPLTKNKNILQVDYFTSKIVQTSRENLEDWEHVHKPSKQQQKLWQYLEKQDLHNQKYWRFKKNVNKKYFHNDLPENYRNTIVSDVLKEKDFLTTPTYNKLTSSLMMTSSIPMDDSIGDFATNFETWKDSKDQTLQQRIEFDKLRLRRLFSISMEHKRTRSSMAKSSPQPNRRSKGASRYSPLDDNFSVILEQEPNSLNRSRKTIQTSIYKRSMGRGIQRSFETIKARPMSQQLKLGTQKVKKLIQTSVNPETNPKNIRHRLKTLTEQQKINKKIVKTERKSILEIINQNQLLNFLQTSKAIDPKRKGIFSLEDLKDFEKFNMSFIKYMELKSLKKIDQYAFENFVKQKHSNLQKFQNFILEEFPIETDNKRKLEKVFDQITWEFKRAERKKDTQKKMNTKVQESLEQ